MRETKGTKVTKWNRFSSTAKGLFVWGCSSRDHEECNSVGYCKRVGSEKCGVKAWNRCKAYELEILVLSVREK